MQRTNWKTAFKEIVFPSFVQINEDLANVLCADKRRSSKCSQKLGGRGVLNQQLTKWQQWNIRAHAELCARSSKPDYICAAEVQAALPPRASADWRPRWVHEDCIPYGQMPVDDAVWYPPFLEGKRLLAKRG